MKRQASRSVVRGMYKSTKTGRKEKYDSSYELRRFIALDKSSLVKFWTKDHGIIIPYKSLRRKRKYYPDILVEMNDGTKVLEEVKGYVWNKYSFGSKNISALSYCQSKGYKYRVIFKEHLDIVE